MSLPSPVRRARPEDGPAVAAIYSQTLGEGYLGAEEATRTIARDGEGERSAWFVVEVGGRVVGAADTTWVRRGELTQAAPPEFPDLAQELRELAPEVGRFGLLENVGVLPDYRRRGLATALTEARLDWLRDHGVGLVYTFAWHTPDGIPARPTLLRAGFRPVREIPEFYLEDGLRNGYACPWCGARCHCSALLCVRELEPHPAIVGGRR